MIGIQVAESDSEAPGQARGRCIAGRNPGRTTGTCPARPPSDGHGRSDSEAQRPGPAGGYPRAPGLPVGPGPGTCGHFKLAATTDDGQGLRTGPGSGSGPAREHH